MSAEQPPARAVSYRRKSPSELKRDQQRTIAWQRHTRQHVDTVGLRSSGVDTNDKQERASIVDPEPVLFYSPHHQVDTAALDEYNAAKDMQVGDCDQRTVWYRFTKGYRPFCCHLAQKRGGKLSQSWGVGKRQRGNTDLSWVTWWWCVWQCRVVSQ